MKAAPVVLPAIGEPGRPLGVVAADKLAAQFAAVADNRGDIRHWPPLGHEPDDLPGGARDRIMVALAIGLSVGFSTVVAFITGMTYDSMSDRLKAEFDPRLTSMGGWMFGTVLVIALGVTSVTLEYGAGMVRTSFIVTPNRTMVFAAKAIVTGPLGLATRAVVFPAMFLVCQPIYRAYGLKTPASPTPT